MWARTVKTRSSSGSPPRWFSTSSPHSAPSLCGGRDRRGRLHVPCLRGTEATLHLATLPLYITNIYNIRIKNKKSERTQQKYPAICITNMFQEMCSCSTLSKPKDSADARHEMSSRDLSLLSVGNQESHGSPHMLAMWLCGEGSSVTYRNVQLQQQGGFYGIICSKLDCL